MIKTIFLCLIIIVLTTFPLWSMDAAAPDNENINISADRLIAHGQKEYAEFSGNVRVTGTDFDITADNLKIFYETAATKAEGTGSTTTVDKGLSEKSFSRIIATGRVVIVSPGKIAKTEKAEYNKQQKTIILTGKGSQVSGETGHIAGEKIIMHTDSNSVTVESGKNQRVKAVINAGQEEVRP